MINALAKALAKLRRLKDTQQSSVFVSLSSFAARFSRSFSLFHCGETSSISKMTTPTKAIFLSTCTDDDDDSDDDDGGAVLKLRKEDDASMVLFVYTVFFTSAVTMYSCYYINTLKLLLLL